MEQSQEVSQQIPSPIIDISEISWFKNTYVSLFILVLVSAISFLAGRSSIQQNRNILFSPTLTISISPTITSALSTPTTNNVQPTLQETQSKKCTDSSECDHSICVNGYCVAVDQDMLPKSN